MEVGDKDLVLYGPEDDRSYSQQTIKCDQGQIDNNCQVSSPFLVRNPFSDYLEEAEATGNTTVRPAPPITRPCAGALREQARSSVVAETWVA